MQQCPNRGAGELKIIPAILERSVIHEILLRQMGKWLEQTRAMADELTVHHYAVLGSSARHAVGAWHIRNVNTHPIPDR